MPTATNLPTNTPTLVPTATDLPTNTPTLVPTATDLPTTTPSPVPSPTLTSEPVQAQAQAPASTTGRATSGLQALYTFDEGQGSTVHDSAGTGLDLTIQQPGAVRWQAGSLTVTGSTLIDSAGAPRGLIDALRASNEITLEAWITPANATQDGPARIMTLSSDIYNRDFMLGQGQYGSLAADVYITRLRTTRTNVNGEPALITPRRAVTPSLTHVVYTRDQAGTARMYINGREVSNRATSGDFSNWDSSYRLILANETSNDRPWHGDYHLVAVYSRALSAAEVTQNFSAGANSDVPRGAAAGDQHAHPDGNGSCRPRRRPSRRHRPSRPRPLQRPRRPSP